MYILGFDLSEGLKRFEKIDLKDLVNEYKLPKKTNNKIIDILIKRRNEYRESKNYNKSDEIRKRLLDFNIELEDSPEQTEWFWRDS
jgi:cysteinyl-tRNA synthetase